jgi:hypothetical protein
LHRFAIEPTRSQDEAEELFRSFHRRNVLAPSNLLHPDSSTLVYVPFWGFSIDGQAHFTAEVCADSGAVLRSLSGSAGRIQRDCLSPSAQIPATFHIRPDLAAGLKPAIAGVPRPSWKPLKRELTDEDAQSLTRQVQKRLVAALPADLHRGIAWELLLRAVRAEEVRPEFEQGAGDHILWVIWMPCKGAGAFTRAQQCRDCTGNVHSTCLSLRHSAAVDNNAAEPCRSLQSCSGCKPRMAVRGYRTCTWGCGCSGGSHSSYMCLATSSTTSLARCSMAAWKL